MRPYYIMFAPNRNHPLRRLALTITAYVAATAKNTTQGAELTTDPSPGSERTLK